MQNDLNAKTVEVHKLKDVHVRLKVWMFRAENLYFWKR